MLPSVKNRQCGTCSMRKATLHPEVSHPAWPRPDHFSVGSPPHAKGRVTVLSPTSLCWCWDCCGSCLLRVREGGDSSDICVNTTNTSDQAKSNVAVLAPTSEDLGVLGEVLGEAFGDLDVDLRSDGFEVWGGVPGSDADFSVSFCKKKHCWWYYALTHLKLYPGWAHDAVYHDKRYPNSLSRSRTLSSFACGV